MCEYCEKVEFETDNPNDRAKLFEKKEIAHNIYINSNEVLNVELHVGYFLVRERANINFCPMCGIKLN